MKQISAIPNKVFTLVDLLKQARAWRMGGKKIAFTNGVFEQIVGAKEIMANGGKVVINPILEGFSTTGIIAKMRDSNPNK